MFYGSAFPTQSPDDGLTLRDFIDSTPTEAEKENFQSRPPNPQTTKTSFFPYPNQSSFLLGEWYWNNGAQKSQRDFKDLIGILSHPNFKPDDIRQINWANINSNLSSGGNTANTEDAEAEWLEEGWRCSPVTIQVPFHRRTENPGPRPYFVGEFYHRSLVAVIKERLESPDVGTHFHFEPYELLWKKGDGSKEIRVYGETYTSEKLLAAYRDLLDSPPTSSCDAPRVIVPLMFWSDATHLTSFGQAKLWPLYLFLGNDSKYMRCKPSANLCSHMAYFQKVDLYLYDPVFDKLKLFQVTRFFQ